MWTNLHNSSEPLIEFQGWTDRWLPEDIPFHRPDRGGLFVWPYTEADQPYVVLQRWLQLTRCWYYIVGRPMVCNVDYEAVRTHCWCLHNEDQEYYPLPNFHYWNHLIDRYDEWVRFMFRSIQEQWRPRYPWLHGEGIYRKPLDFSVRPAIISSGKNKPPPVGSNFQFKGLLEEDTGGA